MPNVLRSSCGPNTAASHPLPASRAVRAPILCSLLQADDQKEEDLVNISFQAPGVFCTLKEGLDRHHHYHHRKDGTLPVS